MSNWRAVGPESHLPHGVSAVGFSPKVPSIRRHARYASRSKSFGYCADRSRCTVSKPPWPTRPALAALDVPQSTSPRQLLLEEKHTAWTAR